MGLKLVVDRITFRFGCLAAAERFSYLKGRLKRFEIERGAGVTDTPTARVRSGPYQSLNKRLV